VTDGIAVDNTAVSCWFDAGSSGVSETAVVV